MNKLKKVWLVIERSIIKKIDYFSPRKYMKHYNRYLRKIGVKLEGEPRYIHPTVAFDGKGYNLTQLGDNVVISKNVLLLNHDYSITCGLRSIGFKIEKEAYWLKNITVGDNVFIGANSTILPGTCIESNCIIGAGSVVKGHISENSIVIGNPARKVSDLKEWAKNKTEIKDYIWE